MKPKPARWDGAEHSQEEWYVAERGAGGGAPAVSICPDSANHLILNVKPLNAATFPKETWSLTVPGLSKDWGQVCAVEEGGGRWTGQRSEQVHGAKPPRPLAQIPKVRAA